MPKDHEGLTPQQRRFVEEYLTDLNATQAAIRAGYSKKSANEQGSRLLANASVARALSNRVKPLLEKYNITRERIVRELLYIGLSDIGEICEWGRDENGQLFVNVKDSAGLRDEIRRMIRSIKHVRKRGKVEEDTLTIELHPKVQALELLGRYLGLLEPGKAEENDGDSPLNKLVESIEALRDQRERPN